MMMLLPSYIFALGSKQFHICALNILDYIPSHTVATSVLDCHLEVEQPASDILKQIFVVCLYVSSNKTLKFLLCLPYHHFTFELPYSMSYTILIEAWLPFLIGGFPTPFYGFLNIAR